MVSLARPITGDRILAQHVFNTTALLAGDAGYGQTVRLVQMSDPSTYANFLGNADATNGLAVQVQYGASSAPSILAQFSKARVYVNQGLVSGQVDRAAPGTTLSAVYPRTSDGRWSSRIGAAGTENPLAYLSESGAGAIASAGDLLYGTGAAAITNLPIGTARQMLTVNAGATAPVWAPSPLSVLTTTGDLLYASAANVQARLAIGASATVLTSNGTLPAWAALPSGALPASDGSTSAPTINFTNSTNSGLYLIAAGTIGITSAGTRALSISSNTGAGLQVGTNVPIVPAAVSGTPVQHGLYRDNVVKGWVHMSGVTATVNASFNVSSTTDLGSSGNTVSWDRDFADANYAVSGMPQVDPGTGYIIACDNTNKAVGGCRIYGVRTTDGVVLDITALMVTAVGNQ